MNDNINPQNSKKAQIKLEWIFGIRKDIIPNVLSLDFDTIVYPAGHYIVIYNHTRKVPLSQIQQFIPGTPHSKGITAFNVVNITKKFIAVAEEFNEDVFISIYNIFNQGGVYNLNHRIVNLSLYENRVSKVYHIAFSQKEHANNYFAAVCRNEDYVLLFWKWDNEVLKDKSAFPLKIPKIEPTDWLQVSFSAHKNEYLVLISNTFLIYYSINNKNFNPLYEYYTEKNNCGKILSYCWLYEQNFLVLTEYSILIFDFQSMKIVQEIGINNDDMYGYLTCVLPLLDAFIVAGTKRRFEIYERKNNENYAFVKKGTSDYEKDTSFDFITLSCQNTGTGNEKSIFAATSNNNLISMNIRDSNDQYLNKISSFSHLISPFHSDSVEGLDVCINKPYVITCSKDKSLRVWDYKKRCQVIENIYEDEMYSVAFHPSGMHAIVSFFEKIKPINIYYDEILSMLPQEGGIPAKNSKDIKFSNGGQYFAYCFSGNKVEIWDFLNMQPIKAPYSRFSFGTNKLFSISWRDDDQYLLACGWESVFELKVKDSNTINRQTLKGHNFISGNFLGNTTSLLTSSDDYILKKFNDNDPPFSEGKLNGLFVKEMINLKKNNKIMICSTCFSLPNETSINYQTKPTSIRLYYDIQSHGTRYEFFDIPSHMGETNRVRINYDENTIFSAGADGSLMIFSLESHPEPVEDSQKMSHSTSEKFVDRFTNVVLIKKSTLKKKYENKTALPEALEETLKKNKMKNLDEKDHKAKSLEQLKTKLSATKQNEQKIISQKQFELDTMIQDYTVKIENAKMESAQILERTKNEFQIEVTEKGRLVEEMKDLLRHHKQIHKEDIETMKNISSTMKANLEKDFQEKITNLMNNKNELKEKIQMLTEERKEEAKAMEWLNGRILNIIDSNIGELYKGIEDLDVHNKHQIKKLSENQSKQQADLSNLERELKQIQEEKDKQTMKKVELDGFKRKEDNDIKETQKKIGQIEGQIIKGKKRNGYLEKCKFVLDYKIKELKKEMGPMIKTIDALKKHTKELDKKLKRFNREHDIINNKLIDFKDLEASLDRLKAQERSEIILKNQFKNSIFNMVNNIDNYELLKKEFNNLRNTFNSEFVPDLPNPDLEAEFNSQKENMRTNVNELSNQLKDSSKTHQLAIDRSRTGNSLLIRKIEKLNAEIEEARTKKKENAADERHDRAVIEIKAKKIVAEYEIEFDEAETVENKIQLMEDKLRERKKYYMDLRVGFDEVEYGRAITSKQILGHLENDNSRHMTENSKKNSFIA